MPRPRNDRTHAAPLEDVASPDAMNSACRLAGPTRAAAVEDFILLTGRRLRDV